MRYRLASRLSLVLAAGLAVGLYPRPATSAPTRDPASGPIAVRVVAGSGLNVRSAPGTGARVLGLAEAGQVYVATARSGEWYRLWFDGRAGWAHGNWLLDDASPIGVVSASVLNVRSGPGTGHPVVGQAQAGQRFAVRSTSGGWHQIDFGGRSAWVSGAYLDLGGGAAPAPRPTPGARPTSAAGYIQLPPSGTGFYCYGRESRRWGTPRMIYGLERAARRWAAERPSGSSPRFGIGDVSAQNGGRISGHVSHQKGVDADISLVRKDGRELPRVDRFSSAYSRAGAQKLVDLFRAEMPVTLLLFNDPQVRGVQPWPNHDNHLHVRIR